MALTETTKIDQIEIIGDYTIQVRNATIIEKDGVELTRTFDRRIVDPITDLTDEDPKVIAIANALWNAEIIEQYRNSLSDSLG
jgi:hypothetical protein